MFFRVKRKRVSERVKENMLRNKVYVRNKF